MRQKQKENSLKAETGISDMPVQKDLNWHDFIDPQWEIHTLQQHRDRPRGKKTHCKKKKKNLNEIK